MSRLPLSRVLLPIATALVAFVSSAAAQPAPIGFQSPSKNIACQLFSIDNRDWLRCDIAEMATTPKRPADCDLDWGHAFEISARGENAARICYGDTVIDPALPVLGYGDIWQRKGLTCTSDQGGVTCFNADRHGFSLSRGKQDLF